jgi:hypothetical protein
LIPLTPTVVEADLKAERRLLIILREFDRLLAKVADFSDTVADFSELRAERF